MPLLSFISPQETKESVANLEMADIDVENGSYKDFVFGIGGQTCNNIKYSLHIQRISLFEYEIYRAQKRQ